MQLLVEAIDQDRHAVEAQALALVVEVKVRVVKMRIPQSIEATLVGLLDRLLVARLVDKVDEVLGAVLRYLLVKVKRKRLALTKRRELSATDKPPSVRKAHRRRDVHDLKIRLVAEVVDLGPVNRNTSSSLDVGEANVATEGTTSRFDALGIEEEELLRLVEVGDMAFAVDSAGEVPSAGAEAVATGDESKENLATVDRSRLNVQDCREVNARPDDVRGRSGDAQPNMTGRINLLH